jgi:hypothetical protein
MSTIHKAFVKPTILVPELEAPNSTIKNIMTRMLI